MTTTENEAIEFLKGKYPSWGCDEDEYENAQTAIQALEEIKAYRAIGTVEECREAVEIFHGSRNGRNRIDRKRKLENNRADYQKVPG